MVSIRRITSLVSKRLVCHFSCTGYWCRCVLVVLLPLFMSRPQIIQSVIVDAFSARCCCHPFMDELNRFAKVEMVRVPPGRVPCYSSQRERVHEPVQRLKGGRKNRRNGLGKVLCQDSVKKNILFLQKKCCVVFTACMFSNPQI